MRKQLFNLFFYFKKEGNILCPQNSLLLLFKQKVGRPRLNITLTVYPQVQRPSTVYRLKSSRAILILTILLIGNILPAQTSLSLSQAVKKGLQNNLDIRMNQINIAITDMHLKGAKKEKLPIVDVFAEQGNSIINDRSPTTFINDFYRDRNFAIGINGSWVLFDGFERKSNQKKNKLIKEELEVTGQQAIENTTFEILQAYYDALIKQEILKVAKVASGLSEKRLEDARLKEKLGQTSRYNVLTLENALLLDITNVLQKEQELEAVMVELNRSIGNKKQVDYQLISSLDYQIQEYDLPALKRQLEQRNKELLSQKLLLDIAKLNTEVAQNSDLPNLSLNSGISQRFNGTNFPETPRIKSNAFQFYFVFSASYNLFDGGVQKRMEEEMLLSEQIEEVKIQQLSADLQQTLSANVRSYQKQTEILKMTDQLLKNLQLSLQLEQDRYDSGLSSVLDFRTVQLDYINAQLTRLETIYELMSNELSILKLTNGLNKDWGKGVGNK